MEKRKIMIVDSSTQKRVTVETDATTFGQLKQAARAAGINYEGKDWLEGLTKTTPMSDDSLLPVNVRYKDTITNNLVFMITNTQKKIRSGMANITTRQEATEFFKSHKNEADNFKSKFGKHWTNSSTNVLIDYINNLSKKATKPSVKPATKPVETKAAPVKSEPKNNCNNNCDCDYKKKYETLLNAVKSFVLSVFDAQNNTEIDFDKLSSADINDMFKNLKK